jgi:hypothetical protein
MSSSYKDTKQSYEQDGYGTAVKMFMCKETSFVSSFSSYQILQRHREINL